MDPSLPDILVAPPRRHPWTPPMDEHAGPADRGLPRHRHHHGRQRALGRRPRPSIAGDRSASGRCARSRVLEALTLYSFSSENWKRPAEEIDALMSLYLEYLESQANPHGRERDPLPTIGRREGLSASTCSRRPTPARRPRRTATGLTLMRRPELRLPGRDHGRGPIDRERRPRRLARSGVDRRGTHRRPTLDRRTSRSRSAAADRRGDADLQFPALADQLRGARGDRRRLAGLQRRRPPRGVPELRRPGPTVGSLDPEPRGSV